MGENLLNKPQTDVISEKDESQASESLKGLEDDKGSDNTPRYKEIEEEEEEKKEIDAVGEMIEDSLRVKGELDVKRSKTTMMKAPPMRMQSFNKQGFENLRVDTKVQDTEDDKSPLTAGKSTPGGLAVPGVRKLGVTKKLSSNALRKSQTLANG